MVCDELETIVPVSLDLNTRVVDHHYPVPASRVGAVSSASIHGFADSPKNWPEGRSFKPPLALTFQIA